MPEVYEWYPSDHPWARDLRIQRTAAGHRSDLGSACEVRGGSMREKYAEPDDVVVARLRRQVERNCPGYREVGRPHDAVVPPGLLAHAICAVKDGTCSPEWGRTDNEHLSYLRRTFE